MSKVVIDGCAVATMDPNRAEYAVGHLIIDGMRISTVAEGPAPQEIENAAYVDGSGCLATPGLVNTHHHLYQWVTRGYAVDDTLFGWLQRLYPVWGRIDEDIVRTAATGALSWLVKTGCTLSTDHHYVFPHDGGDLLGAEIQAAREVGLRFHPTRGSMDLGVSKGGLPPDNVVEDIDAILAASHKAIEDHHDPSPDSMLQIALAPCSPFSVTGDVLKQSALLAREHGVRLHTHLCETIDEQNFCWERFSMTPVQYMETLGWLGPDVWYAHAVHLDDASIATMASTGTGAAHCPSSNARLGSGIARIRDLHAAGVPVGLGVDGAASNESASMWEELHHSLQFARAKDGPKALSVRDSLELATLGGARVLGRDRDLGSLEVGKLADIVLWRMDTLRHIDIADPVAALVLGSQPPIELLLVGGRPIVAKDELLTVDEHEVAHQVRDANIRLFGRAN